MAETKLWDGSQWVSVTDVEHRSASDPHSQYALADGSRGDFATEAQGALADTATQPGDLATVATTGDYDDLSNKPTIGDASGPASATDSAIALFDGTGGKTLKDSAVTISTDEDLTSDSDSKVPTEQAVKAYVDNNAGGGGGLWQQHSETTLGSTAASVALSLPATYQAVRIIAQIQSTHSSTVNVYGTVNADSGSNYDQVLPPVNTSFATWANSTVLKFGSVGSNGASEVISELEIWHEVRQSGKYAYFRHRNFHEWEYVDRQSLFIGWNRWRDTSTAISTLTLFLQSSKEFEVGSYFRVEYIA